MKERKIVVGDYIDPETKMRFVEDDRGNRYYVPAYSQSGQDITIVLDSSEAKDNEIKRLRRILEKLRVENNWLWSVIEKAKLNRKRSPKYSMDELEKAVKERTR